MAKGISVTCGMILFMLVLLAGRVWAVELADYSVTDEEKRIKMVFSFSEAMEAQIVSNYQYNFVSIGVPGLEFPQELIKSDHHPQSEELVVFYRFIRFHNQESGGEIRIYLGRLATPADTQVVPFEDRIDVELVKPLWKLDDASAEEPADTGVDEAADDGVASTQDDGGVGVPDDTPPDDAGPVEDVDLPGTLRDGLAPEPETNGSPAVDDDSGAALVPAAPNTDDGLQDAGGAPDGREDDTGVPSGEDVVLPADGGDIYGQTSFEEMMGQPELAPSVASDDMTPESDGGGENGDETERIPIRDTTGGPSYTLFDLDDVPIAQVRIPGLPFNEAIMELVAESGFNVVVGEGVGDMEVSLDFRQKDLSLKAALDVLCIAYDLTYTVEDDAIIIKGKS